MLRIKSVDLTTTEDRSSSGAIAYKFPGICHSLIVSRGKSWSAVWNNSKKSNAAQTRFWPVSGPFWIRVGVAVWVRVRVRVRVRVMVRGWVGSTPVP